MKRSVRKGRRSRQPAMALAAIRARFKSEWVLLEDPATTKNLEITAGRIVWHSKSRDEVYRKAAELKPENSAIIYTGKFPRGAVIVL